MLAIGIILILVAAGGGGYLGYLASQTSSDVVIGSTSTGIALSMLPLTLFGSGVASVILLWLGWKLTGVGFRRKRAQRRELKGLRASGVTAETGGQPGPKA
ncbi:hypothetical protein [Lapillicoccus sp.]|uniref:hypothetical protein n=1 Tax=Lapillicoccus sp. TaxID=1909287 RepID=UPI0025E63060|nr:hypothetical protein [Lapillicoccus sp.]